MLLHCTGREEPLAPNSQERPAQPYKGNQIFNSSFQDKSSSHALGANTETEQRRKPLASVRAPGFQNCFNKSLHLLGKSVPRFMVSLGVIHFFKVEPDPSLTRNNDIFCFVWSQHHRYQLLLNIVTQGNPHLHFVSNFKKILFHQHLHIVSAGGSPSRHHCFALFWTGM